MDRKGHGLVARVLLTLGAPIGLFLGSQRTVVEERGGESQHK